MKIKMTYDKKIRTNIIFVFGPHMNSYIYNYYASDKEFQESNYKFPKFQRRMKCE